MTSSSSGRSGPGPQPGSPAAPSFGAPSSGGPSPYAGPQASPMWTPASELPTQRLPHQRPPFIPTQRRADDRFGPVGARCTAAPARPAASARPAAASDQAVSDRASSTLPPWPLVTLVVWVVLALGLIVSVLL